MKNIIFVDDDMDILTGLKRMFRPMRHEWKMSFASSGKEALELMDGEPMDVIVSDMRMPEMNGAQLLMAVKEKWPQTVRIILSGHSDQELILRSVEIAHRYLAKPCDGDVMREAVERGCSLRNMLHNPELESIVSGLESLPSLPHLYTEIIDVLKSPDPSIKKIGEIVEQDIGMTTKILQLVNSAFFGLPRHVASPTQAITLLGIDVVKSLVFAIQVFSQFDAKLLHELHFEKVWSHSVNVGNLARMLAMEAHADSVCADQAYLAGIIHDVGKLILAINLRDQYAGAIHNAVEKNVPLFMVERDALGTTHAEVGAYLLGLWGMPDAIVEAVAYHHAPLEARVKYFVPLTAVHVGNLYEHYNHNIPEEIPAEAGWDEPYLQSLDDLDSAKWLADCRAKIKEVSDDEA
ncbi:HDOD domain-containing protein [Candidatus Sumerlaeota bacterium]|nr:HDOD domain-containing protein [Candidatus Sumerlaeota bacterium]